MMHRRKNINHKIALAAMALVVSFAAYDFMSRTSRAIGADEPEELLTEEGVDMLAQVKKIQSINLDGSIFTNQVFRSLVDRSIVIPPQPVGKPNPFAPLGPGQGAKPTPRR